MPWKEKVSGKSRAMPMLTDRPGSAPMMMPTATPKMRPIRFSGVNTLINAVRIASKFIKHPPPSAQPDGLGDGGVQQLHKDYIQGQHEQHIQDEHALAPGAQHVGGHRDEKQGGHD